MIASLYNKSIKRKLMMIMLLTGAVVLFITSIAFIGNEAVTFRTSLREEMLALADVIGNNTSAAIMFNDQTSAVETLAGLRVNPRIIAVYLFNNDERLFASFTAAGIEGSRWRFATGKDGKLSVSDSAALASLVKQADGFWYGDLDLHVTKQILVDGRKIGTIFVLSDMSGLSERLKLFFVLVAFVTLGVSLVAYLLSAKLQGFISGPILNLVQTMKHVSQGKNYDIRAEKTCNDEIGTLIDGFNEMLVEISERDETLKQRQDNLEQLAHFDSLTRLPNRVLFLDRLSQALLQADRIGQPVAVMFIDLDHFKDINDTLGHRIGDLLLIAVATRLQEIVRASDTVARMGGDEFTIFMQNVENPENSALVAQKVVETIAEPYLVEGTEIYVTASVGITLFPNDGATVDELLKNADTAMYHAKDNGKNSIQFYEQEMNVRASNRLAMQNSLRHALERNEFVLYYQPKVDLAGGQVTGMEALLRWSHPEKGIVGPDKFIPLAEETGLIIQIGEWVLRAACMQIRAWQEQGHPPLCIAVNVSAVQFKKPNFAETVSRILEETGTEPYLLELELTESTIMQDVDSTIKMLNTFKEMGIKISIDDFGTGYSSLSQLKRFPIDFLKIDRSFIFNLTSSKDDRAIVTAIIAMARSLGLKIIAEGVETEAQRAFLTEEGCQEMQGYLYSRPVPADVLSKLIHAKLLS